MSAVEALRITVAVPEVSVESVALSGPYGLRSGARRGVGGGG